VRNMRSPAYAEVRHSGWRDGLCSTDAGLRATLQERTECDDCGPSSAGTSGGA
jgi:hypothetical protein